MGERVEALPDNEIIPYEDAQSSTGTIASSIYAYEIDHGRLSHSYNECALSNDQGDTGGLDITYHAWRMMLADRAFLAPIPAEPTRIIDIGTGSGIWALDVGQMYPDAKVVGTDLSLIKSGFVPPNVEFEVCDCTEVPWVYSPNSADLIHTRLMNGFGICDWVEFYKESFKVLKPGGYVESQDLDFIALSDDDSLAADSAILKWCTLICQGALSGGDLQLRLQPSILRAAMEEAGFIDITIKELKMPIGLWPADARLRDVGKFALGGMLHAFQGISITILTSFLGWSVANAENLMNQVNKEWGTRSIHSYWPCFVVYGKKPADAV